MRKFSFLFPVDFLFFFLYILLLFLFVFAFSLNFKSLFFLASFYCRICLVSLPHEVWSDIVHLSMADHRNGLSVKSSVNQVT